MMFKWMAKKPFKNVATYLKFGFVVTEHEYYHCPRCGESLNAGPNYQPNYCDRCGQKLTFEGVEWKEDKEIRYLPMVQGVIQQIIWRRFRQFIRRQVQVLTV